MVFSFLAVILKNSSFMDSPFPYSSLFKILHPKANICYSILEKKILIEFNAVIRISSNIFHAWEHINWWTNSFAN